MVETRRQSKIGCAGIHLTYRATNIFRTKISGGMSVNISCAPLKLDNSPEILSLINFLKNQHNLKMLSAANFILAL